MTSIKVTNIPVQPLFLGFPGENDSRPVYVDVSPWLEEFPDATVSIVYTRSDGRTYAVVVNQPGPVVTWKPMEADLVEGKCRLQIQIKQGDAVKKDSVVDCYVGKSLDDPSDPPQDPRPTYVEEVIDAADRAEAAVTHYPQIRNDYWWVWDAENGEWVNTGVKATGEGGGGSATVIVTIDDTTDPPTASMTATEIKAAVDANERVIVRYAGAEIPYVTYTDRTAIFANLLDLGDAIVAASVMVSSSGTASVDTTSVAASSDIPNVPQMATQSDMVDWTSGKTVDAATMKTVVTAAGLRVSALEDDVSALERDKANASDIPTDNAELANGAGYQTASDVQTAIAGVRQLPTVSASDNGKFLRVVSGAWAAETVSTWQGGSY